MSSSGNKRAWVAPVATALSIRSTAGTVGPGADNFMKVDPYHRQGIAPTAPLADVGALPIPSQSETVRAGDTDQRTWEGPVVTTLVI
jgi:hypothetical protein